LYVESRPSSPERLAEYHRWYDEQHLREVAGLDGFVAARRYTPLDGDGDGDGSFVAIYEIESDDLQATFASLADAATRGDVFMSDAIEMDPPPTFRLMELRTAYEPGTGAEADR
jgi:hypothetical protein